MIRTCREDSRHVYVRGADMQVHVRRTVCYAYGRIWTVGRVEAYIFNLEGKSTGEKKRTRKQRGSGRERPE